MLFISLAIIPAIASAFAPISTFNAAPTHLYGNKFDTNTQKVVSKSEDLISKADDLVISDVKRIADHIPIVFTLNALGNAAGSSKLGVDATAATFAASGPASALGIIPTWTFNVWPLIAVCQLASVAKSILGSDSELSQSDITSTALSNWAATKALTSGSYVWLIATSILSSYSARNGSGSGKVTIHNSSLQVMSSFTTVLTILATISKTASYVPFLAGKESVIALAGYYAYYALVTREDNGTVKKSVNAGIIGGILWNKITTGALNFGSIGAALSMSSVTLAAAAVVFYFAAQKVKDALNGEELNAVLLPKHSAK